MSGTRSVDELLTERIGLDPGSVGSSLVARGLEARMSALGLNDRNEYERHLSGSGEEFQALVEEVVVPESWFFRDDRPFTFLQDQARSKWLIDPSRPPLRVLSLPCAGGEEPYSIAIALREAGLPPTRFRVDAVDLSARSLARARQAIYGRNAFRGSDLAFRSRYFKEQNDRYELDASVRNAVRLIQGNILDSRLLANEPTYDIVFCRNLLIYFTEAARARAWENLLRLLAESGLLFLGHAERLETAGVRLTAIGDKGTFAYQRVATSPPHVATSLPSPVRLKAIEPPPRVKPTPPQISISSRPTADRARPIDAEVRPMSRTTPVPGPAIDNGSATSTLLDQAAERADQGRYDEAVGLCEQAIRESGASARAFFLLGMARQAAGDRNAAEASFQKAVYLDAQHDEALLALALLAQRRGDEASALGYRRRAERARARKGVG
ncbi:CheR family methyltransferase [Singulisphaera acidiphila]|uniref:Methylase of chemotaxis methyl-accepting protein n=1 Tax=Singulisphaera acidiphila (strain ATCC BAA-1392 / DSM 18658 / VKM B-2454 / MOB10) TaxID=886293 RepID=L0DIA8_SINAD|nr:protein-glutamate O-methyltransferase CheR [Singulisphaera acidiphila]AGA28992.1 methylase of chemotaxis methyl-accepting protein [Singulisphaera acidiphila DSM 18658]